VASRLLTWAGIAIAIAGVVALIWTQVDGPYGSFGGGSERWQLAIGPLFVIAAGLLVAIAAQIMGLMRATRD
jgi:preprotein translocase subunit Sec61beta